MSAIASRRGMGSHSPYGGVIRKIAGNPTRSRVVKVETQQVRHVYRTTQLIIAEYRLSGTRAVIGTEVVPIIDGYAGAAYTSLNPWVYRAL